MTLGQKIQALREQHALSQDELAEKLDVSRQTISNWENDKVKLDIAKAEQMCRLFGISMDLLRSDGFAPEQSEEKKTRKPIFVISVITLVISAAALILSLGLLLSTPSPDAVSSTITFTNSFAFFAVAVVCAAACAASVYFIIKSKK